MKIGQVYPEQAGYVKEVELNHLRKTSKLYELTFACVITRTCTDPLVIIGNSTFDARSLIRRYLFLLLSSVAVCMTLTHVDTTMRRENEAVEAWLRSI